MQDIVNKIDDLMLWDYRYQCKYNGQKQSLYKTIVKDKISGCESI